MDKKYNSQQINDLLLNALEEEISSTSSKASSIIGIEKVETNQYYYANNFKDYDIYFTNSDFKINSSLDDVSLIQSRLYLSLTREAIKKYLEDNSSNLVMNLMTDTGSAIDFGESCKHLDKLLNIEALKKVVIKFFYGGSSRSSSYRNALERCLDSVEELKDDYEKIVRNFVEVLCAADNSNLKFPKEFYDVWNEVKYESDDFKFKDELFEKAVDSLEEFAKSLGSSIMSVEKEFDLDDLEVENEVEQNEDDNIDTVEYKVEESLNEDFHSSDFDLLLNRYIDLVKILENKLEEIVNGIDDVYQLIYLVCLFTFDTPHSWTDGEIFRHWQESYSVKTLVGFAIIHMLSKYRETKDSEWISPININYLIKPEQLINQIDYLFDTINTEGSTIRKSVEEKPKYAKGLDIIKKTLNIYDNKFLHIIKLENDLVSMLIEISYR